MPRSVSTSQSEPSLPEQSSRPTSSTGDRLSRTHLMQRYTTVRAATQSLSAPLTPEDQMLQSMEDASPTRWHRAHTTWFFETFVLKPHDKTYQPIDPIYDYLFNSYYQAVGPQYPRPNRGLVSRPTVSEVGDYRAHVDAAVTALAQSADDATWAAVAELIELGLHHEQQHQELLVTDLKHALSFNPMWPKIYPAPKPTAHETTTHAAALDWVTFPGGITLCGHAGCGHAGDTQAGDTEPGSFAYDCEGPRHQVLLRDFALATRPVTNEEYLHFIEDGGYSDPRWWHAEGWDRVQGESWQAPLYWMRDEAHTSTSTGTGTSTSTGWTVYTLHGRVAVNPAEPVCHISFFEASAFAKWLDANSTNTSGKSSNLRLPTEFELEHAAASCAPALEGEGHFAGTIPGNTALHPQPSDPSSSGLQQLFGDVWEWTQSPYTPYPGFKPAAGAIGEYNGKFMANQMVLRGGSVATPQGHMRTTYRNFFPAHARWQFSGLRLARDV